MVTDYFAKLIKMLFADVTISNRTLIRCATRNYNLLTVPTY